MRAHAPGPPLKIGSFLAVALLLLIGFTAGRSNAADSKRVNQTEWSKSCDEVDRSISPERRAALSVATAKQLGAPKADVLGAFRSGDWSIVYVDSHEADEAFLFYSSDPLTNHYVTLWSGSARSDEKGAIYHWAIKNAPTIPVQLAACFAWYVTNRRS